MRIIRWSVDHGAAVTVFYVVILALAAMAALRLVPLRMMPRVESPLLAVVTRVDGLQVEEVERAVSGPVENAFGGVAGVRYVRSTSMPGMSVVTLEFPYRWDMGRAAQEAAARLASIRLEVQPDEPPALRPLDPLELPVLRLAVRAPVLDLEALRRRIDAVILPRLRAVEGVASVYAVGGQAAPLELVIDRERLTALGLSLGDVRRAVETSQDDRSGGTFHEGEREAAVRVLHTADPLDTVLRPGVRLRDLSRGASVHAHAASHAGIRYRLNGQQAVEVNVMQRADASSPRVVAAVKAEMARLTDENPGLTFEVAYDDAHFVEAMARNLFFDLGLAVLLTGVVLLLFLGDVRGTLIALVTVPVSLSCAILFFAPLGISLDSSSLVGLLLAIGRLVDDSIVDLHAVQRHLGLGKSPRDAAIDGCSEVRGAVIGATVVVCLGVLPLTFCGGLTQGMFVGIVWPFLLSLAASLMVALTLTPLLASRFYRAPSRTPALSRWLSRTYRRALVWSLRHGAVVLCGAVGVCYVAFMMFPLIGSEMMPMSDTGQAFAVLQARPGTSAEDTSRLAGAFEQILLRHREVVKVSTEIGWEPSSVLTGYGMGDETTAGMWVTFTDKDARRASIWDIMDAAWAEGLATIPGLRRLSIKEMGADLMASAMAPVEVVIYGPENERLAWLAERTAEEAARLPGLVQPAPAWSLDRPEWRVRVDPAAAAAFGLSSSAVAQQAGWALDGVTCVRAGQPAVTVRFQDVAVSDPADLWVVGGNGRRVPLGAVAVAERSRGPGMLLHDNLRRANTVSASYRPGGGGSMPLTMALMMRSAMGLPYPPGYGIEQRGDMTQMMDSFHRLLLGLGLSLVLIYLALVVGFRSVTVPLVLMTAIPLELAGVFGALILCHQTFNTVSLLGIVVLSGMDMTASILLIDRVGRQIQRGMSTADALLEAGTARLPAILMTVIVTIATMSTLAFFPRTGMDAYAPLATVIIGGLAVATPLSLLVVPLAYAGLTRRRDYSLFRWASRKSPTAV